MWRPLQHLPSLAHCCSWMRLLHCLLWNGLAFTLHEEGERMKVNISDHEGWQWDMDLLFPNMLSSVYLWKEHTFFPIPCKFQCLSLGRIKPPIKLWNLTIWHGWPVSLNDSSQFKAEIFKAIVWSHQQSCPSTLYWEWHTTNIRYSCSLRKKTHGRQL